MIFEEHDMYAVLIYGKNRTFFAFSFDGIAALYTKRRDAVKYAEALQDADFDASPVRVRVTIEQTAIHSSKGMRKRKAKVA